MVACLFDFHINTDLPKHLKFMFRVLYFQVLTSYRQCCFLKFSSHTSSCFSRTLFIFYYYTVIQCQIMAMNVYKHYKCLCLIIYWIEMNHTPMWNSSQSVLLFTITSLINMKHKISSSDSVSCLQISQISGRIFM